jgi:hypothetical protein
MTDPLSQNDNKQNYAYKDPENEKPLFILGKVQYYGYD